MNLRGFNPLRSPGGGGAFSQSVQGKRLHLGCGRTILSGWVNVDRIDLPGVDVVADLDVCNKARLPFETDTVEEFLLSHVIEHIQDTLGLMQELHRISKPGAKLVARTPYGSSDDAWEDPTHVRPYFIQSWGYFSQPYWWRTTALYHADWQPETLELLVDKERFKDSLPQAILQRAFSERNVVKEMVATLRSVKPVREPKRDLQVLPKINFVLV